MKNEIKFQNNNETENRKVITIDDAIPQTEYVDEENEQNTKKNIKNLKRNLVSKNMFS